MTVINPGLFTSNRQDWATPWDLFLKLHSEFYFTLDVCATKENAKCGKYYTPSIYGLEQSWQGERCWINPPYGREIRAWTKKAFEESAHKKGFVVGLLPARTDTFWFHEYVYGCAQIRFLKGRVKFEGAVHSAPFPSMVVIWGDS